MPVSGVQSRHRDAIARLAKQDRKKRRAAARVERQLRRKQQMAAAGEDALAAELGVDASDLRANDGLGGGDSSGGDSSGDGDDDGNDDGEVFDLFDAGGRRPSSAGAAARDGVAALSMKEASKRRQLAASLRQPAPSAATLTARSQSEMVRPPSLHAACMAKACLVLTALLCGLLCVVVSAGSSTCRRCGIAQAAR
jgi:hypothetical protein